MIHPFNIMTIHTIGPIQMMAHIPNEETVTIIEETNAAIQSGTALSFSTVEAMMDYLEDEEDIIEF